MASGGSRGRLPEGFHWVSGSDKKLGATNPATGEHLTRQQVENRGAQEQGYRSAYEQRKGSTHARELAKSSGATGTNYRAALRHAQATARARGEKFDKGRFDAAVYKLSATGGRSHRAPASPEFRQALGEYRHLVGLQDRPVPTGSP